VSRGNRRVGGVEGIGGVNGAGVVLVVRLGDNHGGRTHAFKMIFFDAKMRWVRKVAIVWMSG